MLPGAPASGLVCLGGPHLLPGDDPPVPTHLPFPLHTDRAGGQRGQVAAGAGLAEQLAPDFLGRPELAQPAFLLLIVTVGEDGRGRHAQSDAVALGVVGGRARGRESGVDDALQGAGDTEAAEAFRVVHPGQARVKARVEELLLAQLGRVVRGQERPDPAGQRIRGGFRLGQHFGPPAT